MCGLLANPVLVSYKDLAVVLFEISQMFSLLLYLVFPNIIQVGFSYLLLKVPIIYSQVIGEIFANTTSIDLKTYEISQTKPLQDLYKKL